MSELIEDFDAAYTLVTDHVAAFWAINAANVVGLAAPEMRYERIEQGQPPETYFARFAMREVIHRTAAFGSDEGVRRYTSSGLIFVQVFSPRSLPNGQANVEAAKYQRKLTIIARRMFRGKSIGGCVNMRDVRINYLEPEARFLRDNVVGEYSFDEMG